MAFFRDFESFLHPLLAALVYLIAGSAFAENGKGSAADQNAIKLSVRTIQASEPSRNDELSTAEDRSLHVDNTIRDLAPKLSQLPFSNFQLLSMKEEVITLKTRDSLKLPNGHSLTFRPMYIDEKKVGLWLNWRDEEGSEILNTRLHFDATDSVLTGTDCAHNKGLILAIKATAAPR